MKRIFQELMWFVIVMILFVIQTTLFINTELLQLLINPILFITILFALLKHINRALYIAAVGGYFLDLFSSFPFGLFTACLIITVTIIHLLQKNIFKNDALHAFIINGLVATVAYHLMFNIMASILITSNIVVMSSYDLLDYFQKAGLQTLVHLVLITIIILSEAVMQKKFVRSGHAL